MKQPYFMNRVQSPMQQPLSERSEAPTIIRCKVLSFIKCHLHEKCLNGNALTLLVNIYCQRPSLATPSGTRNYTRGLKVPTLGLIIYQEILYQFTPRTRPNYSLALIALWSSKTIKTFPIASLFLRAAKA